LKNLSAASFLSVTLIGSAVSGFVSLALIDASIKSVVLLLLAAMTCFALTRASAATRHLVWAATILGLLLMPACALLLPDWRVLPEWLSWENRIEMEESTTHHHGLDPSRAIDAPERVNPRGNTTLSPADGAISSTRQTIASMPNTSNAVSTSPELNPRSLLYAPIQIRLPASLVLGLWSSGFFVCLLPAIVSFFRLRKLEQRCEKHAPLSAKAVSRIKKIADNLGIAVPRLLIGPAGTMPMVWSFGRPRLLLPTDMELWSEAKTRAVLLHELIHLRRHDPVVCSLGLIARALNWFNPLAWYAVHRLRMECEQACDDQVLQQGMEASEYAGHLLELSTFVRYESKTLPLAMAMATKPGIETRIASILNESQDRRGVTTARVFAMFAAVSIGVAMLASTATRGVSNEQTEKDKGSVVAVEDAVRDNIDIAINTEEGIVGIGDDPAQAGDLLPTGKRTPKISGERQFETQLRKLLSEVISRNAMAQRFIQDKVAGKPVKDGVAVASDDRAEPQLDVEPLAKQADDSPTALESYQKGFLDLSLEECIAIALINTQVVRTPKEWLHMETKLAATSVSPIVLETTSQSDVVDQNGNRVRPRGSAREGIDENVAVALQEVDARRNAFGGKVQASTRPKNSTTDARPQLVNRIPVVLARINDDISVGQYEERICNLVRDIEFAYWDLYAAYFYRDTARTAMDSTAITYKMTRAKFEAGGQAANGEAQARVTFHQFRAALDATLAGDEKTNEPGLFKREQALRFLMGWAASDGRLIRPSDKPAIGLISFDCETARKDTLTNNIDLRQQAHAIKQRELELMSAKNQAMAQSNQNPNGRPGTFDELFGRNIQESGVRMDFNPNPLGSRRALNDVQNKQLSLAREHRIREAKEIAAVNKLTSLCQQVGSVHKQMTDQFQALNAAQTLVKVSQAKFDADEFAGKPDAAIDNLLRAQQIRSTASQNYIRAVTDYNKALVEVHATKGSLLEYNNLKLQDCLPLCP
jgi:beta-lactamase regulating signal transducer with metallopeptidase domain